MENKSVSPKIIGTHDGKFHCDEVFACALLKLLPEYSHAVIKRSRDPSVLQTCDIVVDVGGIFDASKNRFDHHQRSFNETFSTLKPSYPWVTRLSSAGLIYLHYGMEIISHVLNNTPDSILVQEVYKHVYENFVEEIDAIDNGISASDGLPRYKITTNLSARIGNLNPAWNEGNTIDVEARFLQAINIVTGEFLDKVNYYGKSWWPARDIVMQSIENRFNVDTSGKIIELKEGNCPWREHLFILEKELGLQGQFLYVIFPDNSSSWRVQCVPVAANSFELRLALPEEWRGLRNNELDEVSGFKNCIFVHATGFIGGHQDREGALNMARKALTYCK